jgi:ABC-type glutathione transport system ATPase component
MSAPFVDVRGVSKAFRRRTGLIGPETMTQALNDVSFAIERGEILGMVGESGSGKSTAAKILLGLLEADSGAMTVDGARMFGDGAPSAPSARRGVQMVFQDPYSSLNPRMRVRDAVGEGLLIAGKLSRAEIDKRVVESLAVVGLDRGALAKYPHQFSGGQRQRICIARALILEPRLLIADEPVSALDVSVQMQVLNLLLDLREKLGLTMLFISHDMAVIDYLCDRVVVLYRGEIVETGKTAQVLDEPSHPYTRKLIDARPGMRV